MHTSVLRGLALASLATLSALGATVGVAGSAGAADTTTTFTLTGGTGLSISAPNSTVDLGSANLDATQVAKTLGTVRVDDTRAALLSSWTATVSTTDFVYDQDGAAQTTEDRHTMTRPTSATPLACRRAARCCSASRWRAPAARWQPPGPPTRSWE